MTARSSASEQFLFPLRKKGTQHILVNVSSIFSNDVLFYQQPSAI